MSTTSVPTRTRLNPRRPPPVSAETQAGPHPWADPLISTVLVKTRVVGDKHVGVGAWLPPARAPSPRGRHRWLERRARDSARRSARCRVSTRRSCTFEKLAAAIVVIGHALRERDRGEQCQASHIVNIAIRIFLVLRSLADAGLRPPSTLMARAKPASLCRASPLQDGWHPLYQMRRVRVSAHGVR